jgi:hypothetical protein
MRAVVAIIVLAVIAAQAQAEPARPRQKAEVQSYRDAKQADRRPRQIPHLILGIGY